jgi:hypothetical protein
MKENLEGFQHLNYKPAQWEPKPSFKEARKITTSFSSGAGVLLSSPAPIIDISRKYLPLILSR